MTETALPPDPSDLTENSVDFVRSLAAESFDVVVDGTIVPGVTASKFVGNEEYARHHTADVIGVEFVEFTVDRRLAFDVPAQYAETVARLVADSVAVNLGFSSHPRPGKKPNYRGPYRHGHGESLADYKARPYHNGLLDLPTCPSPN